MCLNLKKIAMRYCDNPKSRYFRDIKEKMATIVCVCGRDISCQVTLRKSVCVTVIMSVACICMDCSVYCCFCLF